VGSTVTINEQFLRTRGVFEAYCIEVQPVKIKICESGCFAMQKSRFYRAKPTLLERKTTGFVIH